MNRKEQRAAAFKAAQDIIDRAKAAGRDLTADENAALEQHIDEVKALDEQIAEAAKGDELVRRLGEMKSPVESLSVDEVAPAAKSLGEHFVKSVGESIRGRKGSKFDIVAPEFKASTDVHVTPGAVAPALTTIDTNIVTGVRRRLTVADLLGSETISGTALTYFVEGPLEGDFALVDENGQKPQIHFGDPTPVTESLKKIAAFFKESDEIVNDLPWLVSTINNRALYQLGLFEENQLLAGSGTGANLRGILNRSGIQTEAKAASNDSAQDALFRAITKTVNGSGLDADGIVINPADYQALRLSKDNNGQYFGGGFFAGQYGNGTLQEQPPLWGLRTVVTPAISAGTALVGAFGQAASLIRKGGVTVETTNSDEDDFTNNRLTIRVEERIALAVRRPSAFVKVDLVGA